MTRASIIVSVRFPVNSFKQTPLSHPTDCSESHLNPNNWDSLEPLSNSSLNAPRQNSSSRILGPKRDRSNEETSLCHISDALPSPQVFAKDATAVSEDMLSESPTLEIPIDRALLEYDLIYKQAEEPLASGTAAFEAGEDITRPSLPNPVEPDYHGNSEAGSAADRQSSLMRESSKRPQIRLASPE